MKIRNFTPHAITVFDGDLDPVATFEPRGLARAKQEFVTIGQVPVDPEDVPLKRMTFGAVEGLPETAEEDEYFIVSSITAQAARATNHPLADRLLVTADPVRNADGQIIGCQAFSVI